MIRNGDITAAEAVEEAIKRAEKIQPQLNFMVTDTFAMARERAKTALTGPFAGVPYLVKDLNDVIGVRDALWLALDREAPAGDRAGPLRQRDICRGHRLHRQVGDAGEWLSADDRAAGLRADAQSLEHGAFERRLLWRLRSGDRRRRRADGARQ